MHNDSNNPSCKPYPSVFSFSFFFSRKVLIKFKTFFYPICAFSLCLFVVVAICYLLFLFFINLATLKSPTLNYCISFL